MKYERKIFLIWFKNKNNIIVKFYIKNIESSHFIMLY